MDWTNEWVSAAQWQQIILRGMQAPGGIEYRICGVLYGVRVSEGEGERGRSRELNGGGVEEICIVIQVMRRWGDDSLMKSEQGFGFGDAASEVASRLQDGQLACSCDGNFGEDGKEEKLRSEEDGERMRKKGVEGRAEQRG